jgi:hypothetical protein
MSAEILFEDGVVTCSRVSDVGLLLSNQRLRNSEGTPFLPDKTGFVTENPIPILANIFAPGRSEVQQRYQQLAIRLDGRYAISFTASRELYLSENPRRWNRA